MAGNETIELPTVGGQGPFSPPFLVVAKGDEVGRRYLLERPELRIGNGRDNDVCVFDERVDTAHARLIYDAASRSARILDLGSRVGTLVNGEPVSEAGVELRTGAQIKIGPTVLLYDDGNNPSTAYHEQMFRAANCDALTGLVGRRYFEKRVAEAFEQARARAYPLSVVIFAVDEFTKRKREQGRLAAEAALQALADIVKARVHKHDTAARYRDDSFVILAPGASLDEAREQAEALRVAVNAEQLGCTISAAAVTALASDPDGERLMNRGLAQLEHAQASGGDRVISE